MRQMVGEGSKVEACINHNGRHAGAAVGAGNLDTVSRSFHNARTTSHGLVHLRSRDVLSLPAKGVADPVDEMKKALLIEPHQVAGTKPGVTLGPDVTQDLPLGLRGIGLASKPPAPFICSSDSADRLADLAARTGDAKSIRIPDRRARFRVNRNDRG